MNSHEIEVIAKSLRRLPPEDRRQVIADLPAEEAEELAYWWEFWARPEQLPPEGDWFVWLLRMGRGAGKTRTGAEWAKKKGIDHPGCRIALIAQTFGDGIKVMFEGESGLLSVIPPRLLEGGTRDSAYLSTRGQLKLANGTLYSLYTSERPNQLRGPQHHFAWGDEVSQWLDAHLGMGQDTTFSNLLLGLRLGENPQMVLTTTPRKNTSQKRFGRLLKEISQQSYTVITTGSSYDNLANLSKRFKATVLDKYEGTRLGDQEIHGNELDDDENSLWTEEMLRDARLRNGDGTIRDSPPHGVDLERIVEGVDPAGRIQDMTILAMGGNVDGESTGDEAGIIVAARGDDGLYYVLADLSTNGSPQIWGKATVGGYTRFRVDRICGEKNHGGDMVEKVIRVVALYMNVNDISYKDVWASKGKLIRAEPVAALYEQRKVKHCGNFPHLENELLNWSPGMPSPNRLDALVIALTELMEGSGSSEDEFSPFGDSRF